MRLRRVLRWVRRILLLLLLALVAVYLLRDRLVAEPLARLVASQLSSALGGKFTLERVEGSYFTNLRLVGLRTVETPPEGPLTRLDFDRVEARFSIFALRVDEVRVEGLVAEVDLDRPSEPSEEPFDLGDLPAFPAVAVDGRVAFRAGGESFSIGRFEVAGDGRRFHLRTENLDLAGRVHADSFGGVVERESPDTIVWTSEDELRGVQPRRVRVVLAGGVDAHADVGYGAGDVLVRYQDDRAEITATAVQIDPRLRVDELKATVDVAAGTAAVTVLDATIAEGHCRVRDARVAFDHPFLVTTLAELDVDLPDTTPLHPDRPEFAAAVALHASLRDGVLAIDRLAVRRGPSTVTFQGRATLPADPEHWPRTALDASLDGTLDAGSIPPDPDLPEIAGRVSVSGRVHGTLAEPEGTLRVQGEGLSVAGRPITRLEGEAALAWPSLTVSALRFDSEPGSLSVRGVADLEARTLESGDYELDLRDLEALGRMIPGAPRMAGSLRGGGHLAVGEGGVGRLELKGEGLRVEDTAIDEFALAVALDGDAIALEKLFVRAGTARVEAVGTASLAQKTAELAMLKATFEGRDAELVEPLAIAWQDRAVSFRNLRARVLDGEVSGSGTLGDELAVDVAAKQLAVLDGRLDAAIRATGTLDAPLVELTAGAPELRFRGHAAKFELRARQEAERIVVEALRLDGGDAVHVNVTASWPLVVGRTGVRHTAVKPELALDAHAQFEPFAEELPAGIGFRRLDATARVDGLDAAADFRVEDLRWTSEATVVLAGTTSVEVAGTPERMVATIRTPKGSPVETEATVRSPVGIDWSAVDELVDRLRASTIEGTANLQLVDLSPIGKFEASPVADIRGRATVDVQLSGPVAAPSIHGTARLDCPHVRLKADVPSLQDLTGEVEFDDTEIRLRKVEARLGYAPVRVTGTLRRDRIDVHIVGENILLARTPYLRLRADVDLTMAGPIEALELKGRVVVTDALYSEPIKILSRGGETADASIQIFHLRSGPLSTMKLDLQVRATDSIRIDNNMLQGRISADLRIHGTGAVPLQEGRLDFRDLRFTFPVTYERLVVEQGAIVFGRDDPFNPVVRIRGEKRKLGFDLSVMVTGKINELEIFITSVPALPREEAILLLTTGTLSENIATSGVYTAGLFAGRSILEKVLGPSDPDRESFLDRFDVDTGRDVSADGDPTIEARFRVSEAERWYAIGERDRWGDYNGGVMLRFRFK